MNTTRFFLWTFVFNLLAIWALNLSNLHLDLVPQAKADDSGTLYSQDYNLQLGNFNMTSGEKTGGGLKITDTVGQTAAGEFKASGYSIFAGFQYLYTLADFTFQIDDLNVDLGELAAGQFKTTQNQLTVSTRTAGYTIYALANAPLRLPTNPTTFIPFTACDSGCAIDDAEPWTLTSNVGFGFNVSGDNRASDFTDSTYFRPFADRSDSQIQQMIAGSPDKVTDDTVTITYKATIDGDQAGGQYETFIEYWAIPGY
jgi:hypothetical protein